MQDWNQRDKSQILHTRYNACFTPLPVIHCLWKDIIYWSEIMGLVYADITLQNSYDVTAAQKGHILEEAIKTLSVKALVDTGAITLTINDEIAKQLDLAVKDQVDIELADGTRGKGDLVGPVDICFRNRITSCLALILPDATKVLLGAIPMEGMDVIVDPRSEQLTVHPDRPFTALMKVK